MIDGIKTLVEFLLKQMTFILAKDQHTGQEVRWLPIIEFNGTLLGLGDSGYWVVEGQEGVISLSEGNRFGYVMSALEKSKQEVVLSLEVFSRDTELTAKLITLFPFCEIVESGFKQGSDYWTELAFAWYSELDEDKKKQLEGSLEEMTTAKWASQKNRQRAKKELKAL